MAKYYCTKCNFRFQTDSSSLPTRCPYCGEKEVLNKEESAEQIVEKEDFE